ncbi:uncharacterized protein LAJ45_03427 [Morchella importuna]|uniref:Vacuolar protein sorting 55 n=1 Tax=Morchella conica CCBAS932 TaxID=1392247 RepID=A0A3N4KNS4_9PEZI|nr:uncharacterized protein LAJ45_03427 [Morchella importuna]KAH8152586.1 hypothetical protein LAJ45_03427 [Morchella importuna]RPB11098.1 vacuolar protein sorting 55 [Morchella conica CCBAS932]
MAGLKTIIALSFVLAIGFLLVILSSALFGNYFPLLVVATYCLAPLPNAVCSRWSNPDDFESTGPGLDLGRFLTGFFVVMGIALPAALAHSGIIQVSAMVMSILGGLLIYGTIISFTMFFQEESDF